MKSYLSVLAISALLLTGCSTPKTTSVNESLKEVDDISWSETIPQGFDQITFQDSEEVQFPEFAYKIHSKDSYDCPVGWKMCLQVAVISEKGCPNGIYAIVMATLDASESLNYQDIGTPYISEKDTKSLEPDETRVLKFKLNGGYWDRNVAPIPRLDVIGCNT
jgi:hypothetical protein